MKYTSHRKSNHLRILLIAVVALLVIGSTVLFVFRDTIFSHQTANQSNDSPSSPTATGTNQEPATEDQQAAGDQAKEDFIKNNEATTPSSAAITISSVSSNADSLAIRTMITAVDDSGTCTLIMTSAGKETITQTAGTQSLGSYSVCKGFNIDKSLLSNSTWKAKITYKGSAGQATIEQDVKA